MKIRIADQSDNEQLVALANITPMQGSISICIKRQPDFFSLLKRKGDPLVFVAEEDKLIVGCFSLVKEEKRYLGQPIVFHYLCDLKVHPNYRNRKVATELGKAMNAYLVKHDCDYLFGTVAKGNNKVYPFFNGEAGFRKAATLGMFNILQLVPKKHFTLPKEGVIEPFADGEKLAEFYKKFAMRYVLHPIISARKLDGCKHFVVNKNGRVVAAISLFDTHELKQNVLTGIPWYYLLAVQFLRVAKPVLNAPYMPRIGESIKILYVKAFAYLDGEEDTFISLLSYSNQYSYVNNYSFLSISFHENDKLQNRLKRFIAFPFKSHGMIWSLKNNDHVIKTMKQGTILEDYSLV